MNEGWINIYLFVCFFPSSLIFFLLLFHSSVLPILIPFFAALIHTFIYSGFVACTLFLFFISYNLSPPDLLRLPFSLPSAIYLLFWPYFPVWLSFYFLTLSLIFFRIFSLSFVFPILFTFFYYELECKIINP